ncbi:MAG: LEA type 2 family protein [Bacteroidales bacterium]|nr:LEA type 2 family protein [Bacteroidales bacterium]
MEKSIMKLATKIGILFLFLILSSGCYKDVEFVELESANIKVEDNVGVINLFVKISNPNFYSIQIVESDVDIYLNGTHLGLVSNKQDIKLPANSETVIELPIEVNILDLILNVPNIWNLFKSNDVTYKIEGTIVGKVLFGQKEFQISEEKNISIK